MTPPQSPAIPPACRTPAWTDKCLQTALGSWAQLRHDTILYAKQPLVAAEGGDEIEPPYIHFHYVEPNVEAWRRLEELLTITLRIPLLDTNIRQELHELQDLIQFLQTCAEKQLANRPLTNEEIERLRFVGGEMESIALQIIHSPTTGQPNDEAQYQLAQIADSNMACIADVHTAVDRRPDSIGEVVLEVGVGYAHEIFVMVPYRNRLILTRGAVFSYYEFPHPMRDRLTDEKWQGMLAKSRTRPQPDWIRALQGDKLQIRFAPV